MAPDTFLCMNKREYIEKKLVELTGSSLLLFLPYGCFCFLALSALDYFVTPENFSKFLIYRLAAASSGMALFAFLRLKQNKGKHLLMFAIIISTLVPASMVECMILSFGGHHSIYSVGIIVVLIYILGFLPLSPNMTILVSGISYAVYLLPILIFDPITDYKVFLNSNIFLITSILGMLGWRYFSYRLLLKDLGRGYDLSREKEQLAGVIDIRNRELAISEQKLRALFENATDGILITDKEGKILDVNREACDIYGFQKEALINAKIGLLDANEDKSAMKDRLKRILNGEQLLFEAKHYRKDGNRVSLEVSAKAILVEDNIMIQFFLRDIAEKKLLQEQVLQSQKLDSIGSLAGGVAHDFNNVLTAILGYTDILQTDGNIDENSRQRIRNIESCARKAGMMVSTLLNFTRHDRSEMFLLSVNEVVQESLKLVDGLLDKRVKIAMSLNNDIPLIEGDHNRLEQAVMNLIINAKDAMPDGGLITLKTSVTEVKKDRLDIPVYIIPGTYVLLTVSDTGHGITGEIINRVFDPFFTTKGKGKGTGLGLAIVYGIVKDHRGFITVQSEEGEGSVFSLYLPVCKKPVREIAGKDLVKLEGRGSILVIDDDEDVLNFIRDILETHGYAVFTANNPVLAIDLFTEYIDRIHLVITDYIMPLMDGNELIEKLREVKPSVKILVVSGFGDREIKKHNRNVDIFLRKPFEVSELLSNTRHLLNSIGKQPFNLS
jgi:two-component system, cell cycle sensor histidine kinase and response regulator CckA